MVDEEREDTTIYKVVVNDEEQYSIWPADRENALGWRDAGKTGTKAECLAYISEVWTDTPEPAQENGRGLIRLLPKAPAVFEAADERFETPNSLIS